MSNNVTAIVDYGVGNLFSLRSSLEFLGCDVIVTDKKEELINAKRIILPGVGAFEDAVKKLRQTGLDETGTVCAKNGKPLLGICLGMQLMCKHSEEGNADCLGIFDAEVKRFVPKRHEDKVPHMGWNTITNTNSALFTGFDKDEFVYFVHSYYVPVNEHTAATTDYIHPFSAALHKDNFYATQFHPEKSGSVGERILKNFLDL